MCRPHCCLANQLFHNLSPVCCFIKRLFPSLSGALTLNFSRSWIYTCWHLTGVTGEAEGRLLATEFLVIMCPRSYQWQWCQVTFNRVLNCLALMVALESLSFRCTLFGNYQEEQMYTYPSGFLQTSKDTPLPPITRPSLWRHWPPCPAKPLLAALLLTKMYACCISCIKS